MSLGEYTEEKAINMVWKITVVACGIIAVLFFLAKIPEFKEFMALGSKDPFAMLYFIIVAIALLFYIIPIVWLAFGVHLFLAKIYKHTNVYRHLYYILIIPLVALSLPLTIFNLGKLYALGVVASGSSVHLAKLTSNWAVTYDYKYAQWMERHGFSTRPILYWVATNESTPISTLGNLYSLQSRTLNEGLASNPTTPDEILSNLAANPFGDEIRYLVSKNKSASADTLRRIYELEKKEKTKDAYIIKSLFNHPSTPKDVIEDIKNTYPKERLEAILRLEDRN
jgi:hypothetical protein